MHIPLHLSPLDDLPDRIDLPQLSTATAAGIGVAIAGNILISLALNCQKLAHRRLEREREAAALAPQPLKPTHSNGRVLDGSQSDSDPPTTVVPAVAAIETEPLLQRTNGMDNESNTHGRRWFFFRRTSFRRYAGDADESHLASTHALVPVDVVPIRSHDSRSWTDGRQKEESQDASESDYLKSKLWWFGFLLMNLGETGNFISYAFAPASVVAPLGTFALIANCIFAPVMLKERFRKRDFLGIIIAILGAVTVVLSTNPSDARLNPDGLIKAISQRPFEIYAITYIVGIVLLAGLSERPAGKRWVFVDVGLCALFGGFTVLSTKAISTLLTMEWLEIFKEWITYPVIAILLITGVGQIRYLNRALMRFDSKIVVPTQFVMFNLSAIVGSAILYGDFKKATFHQLVTFLYGCAATFAGVFIIAWAPTAPNAGPDLDENEEPDEDDDDDTRTLPGNASVSDPATATEDSTSAYGSVRTAKVGSLARRVRPTLVMPDGVGSESSASPVLRNRRSVVSLYGLSPAQRVLLISSSPRDEFIRPNMQTPDLERDPGAHAHPANASPGSMGRRRAVSWLDGDFGSSSGHRQESPRAAARTARYGATSHARPHSNAASREGSRIGERGTGSATSRSRSSSRDPFQ